MKARDVMSSPAITVAEDATLDQMARLMLEHRIGSTLVVDRDGKLVGIVTESDFAGKPKGVPFALFSLPSVFGQWFGKGEYERAIESARHLRAADVMTRNVLVGHDEDELDSIVRLMVMHDKKRIPIVRDGAPVGLVARHDILRAFLPKNEQ